MADRQRSKMTPKAEVLGRQLCTYLHYLVQAERPTRDALVQGIALAVGHSIVSNVASCDQPKAREELVAELDCAMSVFQSCLNTKGGTKAPAAHVRPKLRLVWARPERRVSALPGR
jgi:hypothetical protein